jgi:hypothetical protein
VCREVKESEYEMDLYLYLVLVFVLPFIGAYVFCYLFGGKKKLEHKQVFDDEEFFHYVDCLDEEEQKEYGI